MKDDYEGKEAAAWRKGYRRFLENLREVYSNAYIVCMTTLLNHDESWDRAIGQVVSELADGRISQYLFKRNGRGTPGHLRISEAAEMAEELSRYIEGLKIENWSMKTDR